MTNIIEAVVACMQIRTLNDIATKILQFLCFTCDRSQLL